MRVLKRFKDKETKKVWFPLDIYKGDRLEELRKKGLVERPNKPVEKKEVAKKTVAKRKDDAK